MTPSSRVLLLLPVALLLVACSSGGSGAPDPTANASAPAATSPAATSPAATSPAATSPAATSTASAAGSPIAAPPVLGQTWATAELTDVATGSTFRIADLAGRTVILETMAIWCTNCLAQQGDVYTALGRLDPARVAYVVIDVDPSETGEALKAYRDRHGFTGTYAVASSDLARALAAEFGDQVLNPPSTPMVVIGSDGRVTLTAFGHKSADEIAALAREHGA